VNFDRHQSYVQINQHKNLANGKKCHHLMIDRYPFRIISYLLFTIDIRQGYFYIIYISSNQRFILLIHFFISFILIKVSFMLVYLSQLILNVDVLDDKKKRRIFPFLIYSQYPALNHIIHTPDTIKNSLFKIKAILFLINTFFFSPIIDMS
jgi:hypothetical protein